MRLIDVDKLKEHCDKEVESIKKDFPEEVSRLITSMHGIFVKVLNLAPTIEIKNKEVENERRM